MDFESIAKKAKDASLKIADLPEQVKNEALLKIADAIEAEKEGIFSANSKDIWLRQKNLLHLER